MNDKFIIRIKKATYVELQDLKKDSPREIASHPPRPPIYEVIGELSFRNREERNSVYDAIVSVME